MPPIMTAAGSRVDATNFAFEGASLGSPRTLPRLARLMRLRGFYARLHRRTPQASNKRNDTLRGKEEGADQDLPRAQTIE